MNNRIITQALGLRQSNQRPRIEGENDNIENQPPQKKLKPIDINKTIREMLDLFLSGKLNIADIQKNMKMVKREFDSNNKTFNGRKLKEYILMADEQIHKVIQTEVRGKLPSLMFHSATRHGKHVQLVSLRFANREELVERTIGVLTQNQHQSAMSQLEKIKQLLARVGLTLDDIYSTCTNQWANILKVADLTIEARAAIRLCRGISNQEYIEAKRSKEDAKRIQEAELADEHQDVEMLREEEEVDREVGEPQTAEHDETTVADIVAEEGFLCTKMICGNHTCQLAVNEVMNDFKEVIAEIQAVVRASKRMEIANLINVAGIQKLSTGISTNLDSLYQMINDVHRFRNQLEEISVNEEMLTLSENAWEFVTEFVQVFAPVYLAMKDFQKAELTVSNFYIRWEKMELKISKVPNGQMQLKEKLLEALEQQKQKFFESDAFVAALLLDPRINWSQNPEDFFGPTLCERGILQLEKVHQAIINKVQHQERFGTQYSNEDEELNQRLGGGGRRGQAQRRNRSFTLREKVNMFLAEQRLSSRVQLSPLKYWYNRRNEDPEIYMVSQVVCGAVFSQVKVEKDFNGFALVLSYLRILLVDDTLNAVLITKNNLGLLNKVKFF